MARWEIPVESFRKHVPGLVHGRVYQLGRIQSGTNVEIDREIRGKCFLSEIIIRLANADIKIG